MRLLPRPGLLPAAALALASLALLATPWARAGDDPKEPAVPAAKAPVALGNEKCPITGEEVDPSVTSVWSGLQVAFCCPGCISKFEAEPAKYAPRLLEDLAGQVARLKAEHEKDCEPAVPAGGEGKASEPAAPPAECAAPTTAALIDLGNVNCPVMPVHKAKETATLEHHGMKVRFCCKGCFSKFEADPDGYLAKLKATDAALAKKIEDAEAAWKAASGPR